MTMTTPQDGLPTPARYWAMLAIAIGIAMSVLDSAVVNIALPTIARQFQTTPSAAIWVVSSYQIAIVTLLLPLAALGERVGYARVYRAGLVVFTIASACCALADSLPVLIGSRALQGLGAAAIMSNSGALVRYTYPDKLLGRGVGLNALVVSLAAAAGPTLASGILAIGSWPWLFAVNVPIGLFNVVLAWRALPASDRSREPYDWRSAVLNVLLFALLFIGIDAFAHGSVSPLAAAAALAVAALAAVLLVRRALRTPRPLIPLDLLRNPVFALSMGASVCAFGAYMLTFISLPFHFENALGRSVVETGLLMTPWPLALGVTAPIAGRLSDRISAAVLGCAGMLLLAVGLALLALLPADAGNADIAWRMALGGIGFGLFQAPNNRTMLSAAPRDRAGAAGGLMATARLVGMTSGAALAAIVFALQASHATVTNLSVGVVLALMAGVASVARTRARTSQPAADAHVATRL